MPMAALSACKTVSQPPRTFLYWLRCYLQEPTRLSEQMFELSASSTSSQQRHDFRIGSVVEAEGLVGVVDVCLLPW